MKRLTWDVMDGSKTLFWDDSWGGYPSINSLMNTETLKTSCGMAWGSLLQDFVRFKNEVKDGEWEWKSLDNLNVPEEEILQLQVILRGRRMAFRDARDKLIWSGEHSRSYSAKEGYRDLTKQKN